MTKEYYTDEINDTVSKINKNSFNFAVVTDSHLDNSLDDTINNIKGADREVNFKFVAHIGDIVNGSLSREYTVKVLKNQFEKFKSSTSSGNFYIARGNHDGYCNTATGQECILEEELWSDGMDILKQSENFVRTENKSYFYVDYPENKIRLVFIASFQDEIENGKHKSTGVNQQQKQWLKNEALTVGEDWNIMLFSHDTPLAFGDFKENDLFDLVTEEKKERGFSIPAWFIGHFHGDLIMQKDGINFVFIACETAYVPQLWLMPEDGYYPERNLNTVTEDLWDAASLDTNSRTLSLIRFGAGKDRFLTY